MNTFGLSITNPGGELVVSSEARLLHCIGKAVWQSTVQVSGDATAGKSGKRVAGYSIYHITIPADTTNFLMGIDLPNAYIANSDYWATGILKVTHLGSNVYEIKACCGRTYDGYYFDTVQIPVDIWAFGFSPMASNNYGLSLYNSAGVLTADFSRTNILFPRFISQDFRVNPAPQTMPLLGRPVIIGMPNYYFGDIYERATGYLYDYIHECTLWARSGTSLKTEKRSLTYYGCNDLNDDAYNTDGSSIGIVIDGSYLP